MLQVETVVEHVISDPLYSLVIPVRDRYGSMLRNCLRSIELQTLSPIELIIADYGSTQENHENLLDLLPECTVYRYETEEPWSLATARNIGLRRAKAPLSCALDADLIMEPGVLEHAYRNHMEHEDTYQTSQVTLINEDGIDPETIELPRDYPRLSYAPSTYMSEGWGGFTSAPRTWWEKSQGFNEEMLRWGWEDVDMWKRAARAGMNRVRLSDANINGVQIYHQPHDNIQLKAAQGNETLILTAIKYNERLTKRSTGYIRNDEHWGLSG